MCDIDHIDNFICVLSVTLKTQTTKYMRLVGIKCTQFCTSTCIITYFPSQWCVAFRYSRSVCIPDTVIGRTSRWRIWNENDKIKTEKSLPFHRQMPKIMKKRLGNRLFRRNFVKNQFQNTLRVLTIVLFVHLDARTIQLSKDKKSIVEK